MSIPLNALEDSPIVEGEEVQFIGDGYWHNRLGVVVDAQADLSGKMSYMILMAQSETGGSMERFICNQDAVQRRPLMGGDTVEFMSPTRHAPITAVVIEVAGTALSVVDCFGVGHTLLQGSYLIAYQPPRNVRIIAWHDATSNEELMLEHPERPITQPLPSRNRKGWARFRSGK